MRVAPTGRPGDLFRWRRVIFSQGRFGVVLVKRTTTE
jgi:hypothetical protein